MKESESTIRVEPVFLEYGDAFGPDRVTVRVKPESLLNDLIVEARGRNIPEENIQKVAGKTSFTLLPWTEFVDNKMNLPAALKPLMRRSEGDTIATVLRNTKDETYVCQFNIEKIVSVAGNTSKIKEVRQGALALILEKSWNHEREHLLQYMDPDVKKQISEVQKNTKKLIAAGLAVQTTGGLIMIGSFSALPASLPVTIVGAGICLTGFFTIQMASYNKDKESDHEREAYAVMNTATRKTLFDITFE